MLPCTVCFNISGSCIDRLNAYVCQCPAGFSGSRCEKDLDECRSLPCLNQGTCVDLPGAYRCRCGAGYTGDDCASYVDRCVSSPCHHGGTCLKRLNGYKCQCPPGFTGNNRTPLSSLSSKLNINMQKALAANVIAVLSFIHD